MLRRLIRHRLDAEAASLGASMDYAHHLADVSLVALLKFALFLPLARHRKACPSVPYHVARLVAVRAEGCGTCVQIECNLARQAGVPPDVLRAVLNDQPDYLPAPLADVYRFASALAVQRNDPEIRERLRAAYGDESVAELALAMAAARFFPAVKRALGYATPCTYVNLDGEPVTVRPIAA